MIILEPQQYQLSPSRGEFERLSAFQRLEHLGWRGEASQRLQVAAPHIDLLQVSSVTLSQFPPNPLIKLDINTESIMAM